MNDFCFQVIKMNHPSSGLDWLEIVSPRLATAEAASLLATHLAMTTAKPFEFQVCRYRVNQDGTVHLHEVLYRVVSDPGSDRMLLA